LFVCARRESVIRAGISQLSSVAANFLIHPRVELARISIGIDGVTGKPLQKIRDLHSVCSALEQNDPLPLQNGFDHALEVPPSVDLTGLAGSVDETANNARPQKGSLPRELRMRKWEAYLKSRMVRQAYGDRPASRLEADQLPPRKAAPPLHRPIATNSQDQCQKNRRD